MEEAIAFCRLVMKKSGQVNFRNDLEWIVKIAGRPAVILFTDQKIPAFGLAFHRTRPLRFPPGGIVLFEKELRRLELGAGPVIASDCLSEDEIANIEKQFLAIMCKELLPGEVLCFEALPTASRLHRIIVADPEIHKNFQVLYLQRPHAHHFARLPNSFDAYLMQLGTRSRKSLQYSRNLLKRECEGNVAAVCFNTVEGIKKFLDDAIKISKTTYQWRLLGLGLRNREDLEDLYRFAAEHGWLRCYILYCKITPVAFMVGYHYENCFFYIDVGYDPEWAKYSVGSVLQWEVMEDLYRHDNTPSLFDFSTGYGPHKRRFGKESREEVNMLLLPTTPGNRLLAVAWRNVDGLLDLTSRTLDNFGLKQSVTKAIRGVKTGKRMTSESKHRER
jgi:Acetyltransferase (GNAT) domain